MTRFIVLEPFYGGSHRQLIDTILEKLSYGILTEHVTSNLQCSKSQVDRATDAEERNVDHQTVVPTGTEGNSEVRCSRCGGYVAELYTLPDKKWHWKARVSALHFSQVIQRRDEEHETTDSSVSTTRRACNCCNLDKADNSRNILFCSSVLNLAELVALRPDLSLFRKIIYFHENQLQYPVQKDQQRDFQYGYNQIVSCLVADVVLFNSSFNLNSFVDGIPKFLHQIPHQKPNTQSILSAIHQKSSVLPFIMDLPAREAYTGLRSTGPLCIIWPHRWEHDKDPETFFSCLMELVDAGFQFKVSVIGEKFQETPEVFEACRARLSDRIVHWGYLPSRRAYFEALASAHVVVSTARHEFFGVAMLEAVHLGCYPIAPDDLAYPEHFPEECLYRTRAQLVKKLRYFCRYPEKTRMLQVDTTRYSWEELRVPYCEHLGLERTCQ